MSYNTWNAFAKVYPDDVKSYHHQITVEDLESGSETTIPQSTLR